jgi:hypothetical protein
MLNDDKPYRVQMAGDRVEVVLLRPGELKRATSEELFGWLKHYIPYSSDWEALDNSLRALFAAATDQHERTICLIERTVASAFQPRSRINLDIDAL